MPVSSQCTLTLCWATKSVQKDLQHSWDVNLSSKGPRSEPRPTHVKFIMDKTAMCDVNNRELRIPDVSHHSTNVPRPSITAHARLQPVWYRSLSAGRAATRPGMWNELTLQELSKLWYRPQLCNMTHAVNTGCKNFPKKCGKHLNIQDARKITLC